MNKTRMGKRVASLLLSLVMMLSLLPTAAYATTMADGVDTQGASVSENGTGMSDDSNSSGNTDDLQVGDSKDSGDTGDQQVGGSSVSGTAGDTTGAEGGADPIDSVNGNDSADPQDDGDEVLPVASSVVSTSEELVAAIAAASDGDTITLGAGEFTTVGNTSPEKSLTFVGAGTGTVWTIGDLDKDVGGEGNGDYSFEGCDTITFKNMTLKVDNKNYRGFIRINNTVVENCTLEGRTAYWGYETAKFVGSTFNAPGDDYALWDYSTKAMSFDSCTFNISGKGVHVYVEAANADKDVTRTVAVNNCTVNSDKANKAFLNIKNSTQSYDVTLSGTNTVNGLTANGTTGSALYQVETTEVTETTGNPVTVKAKADDGTVTTLYEVKETVEAYVAEVGSTKYKTLQAAIDAAGRNATVKLLADTYENVTIAKAMTLDLNGFTLNGGTVKATPALKVDNCSVTVKDSSAAQTGTIMREDTAENSGVSSHYVIDIQGKYGFLKFEGGNVKNNSGTTSGKGASLIRLGNDNNMSANPTLTIKGGTFTQDNFIAIKVDRGTLHLLGGTVNSANSFAIENWNNAYIKGGTVNGTVSTWVYSTGAAFSKLEISGGTVNGNVASVNYDNAADKQARVYVTGGTVTGTLGTYTYNNGLVAMDETAKATIEVTGGTFKEDPTQYVVEGSAISKNDDGTFGVAKAYLAMVGDTSYYTMDEAFHAAVASGETLTLLRDYTTGSSQNSGSKSFTIDLNGYTWTYTGKEVDCAAFEINYSDVTLTVKNGKVVSSQLAGLIPSAMSGTITYDNSGLVFENVEMTANGHSGIETNGSNTNDTVTLKNSTLNVPNGYGIYFPSSGTLTIDNSVINAKTMGVQICSGSLNVTGDKTAITVTGDGVAKTENDGAIEDGAAISIVQRTGYKDLSKIEVEDGKFTANGTNAAVKAYKWESQTESAFDNSKNVVAVSGGTFSSEVAKSLCADGFIPTKNEDGTYGVKEGQYVAKVGDTEYATLQAAIDKATEKATVILLADTRENVTISTNRLTLDLNGHTLNGGTVKGKPALTVRARNVIVKDSSAAQTGTIMREDTAENSGVSSHYVIDIQGKNAFLKFESGNVKNNSGNKKGNGASLVRVGDDSVSAWPQLTIAGGTFTQDNFIVIKVDRGTFYLTGGTLNSKNDYAVENWYTATIKGGTVNGEVAAWTYSGGHNSDLTISGGTINGDVTSVNYGSAEGKLAKVSITGGIVTGTLGTYTYDSNSGKSDATTDAAKATIAVTGGTFSKDPTKYVVEDSGVTKNTDGTFGVAKAYLAKVGDTSYYTMDEAFKAQTTSGKAIVLLRDYTTGSTFNSGSIARTVDLNGHTWTCTGTDANSAAFEINYPDASLTVKNGKVFSSQLVGLIPSAMGGTIKYDNSSLVFDGVEMTTNARSGIETNGNNTNDTVTLKNSTLNVPNGFGIYFPSSGKLIIENSKINAKTMGVQVCSGSLNISGADTAITVSGDGIDKTINDGAIEDGAAISIVNRAGYKGLDEIKVEGGKFTAKGDNAAVKAYDWDNTNKTESDFTQSDKVSISGGTFSSAVDKSLCAEGYIPTQNADGTYDVKEGADGYVEDENGNVTISTAEGLFYFAKKVNAGNNFAGKTVTLANNIDLNNEKWTPIGIYGTQATWFKGTFDGQNHAVTGLKVEESRKSGVGFFSKVYTGTIKNLTVEGSVSTSNCNYVGGIVGHGYATITNCTFKGSVGSADTMQVGGIAGSGGFTVTDCSVYADVTAECWAGGIVGNCQDGGAYTNCYVEGIISSKSTFWGGGAAGITPVPLYPSQVISGCYSNTVVKVAGEEVNCPIIACYNNPLDYKGYSGGLKIYDNSWNKQKNSNDSYPIYAEKDKVGGVLMEGMTAARDNSLIMLEDDLNYVTGDLSKVRIMAGSSVTQAQIDALAVASVGDSKYQSLAEAIDAAQDGQTVTLLADATEDVVISKSITLDLGGKTLTNTNVGKATISVTGGTVTVKNGNVVGGTGYYNIEVTKGSNANLTLTDVTATAGNTGSSMIDNWGTLTITSGTYTGGLNVVKSEEGSVLNISGGTFTRKTAPKWGITGTVLVYGTTTITGGTFNEKSTSTNARVVVTGRVDGYDSITYVKGGTFNGNGNNVFHHLSPAQADDSFEVSGGTFNKSIPDYYCADGFIPTKNADGTYGVKEGQYVAQIGSKKYETLADAIRLAAKGKTITLLADVEQNTQLTINKSITLDLNGKTIRNTADIWSDNANAILSITNGAKVTITGNGTIDAKENDCYTINVVKGDLTIENGTFYGNVSVVQVQEGTLSVKGGTFDLHQKWEGSSKYLFNCIDDAYVDGSANVAISGGTFVGFDPNVSPEQKVDGKAPSFAAPGTGITKNEDGSFTAVDGMTAQILDKDGNSVNAYNTLAEAVAAAENGQTVRLLADVAESSIKVNANITIDLNKMTVTGSFVTYGEVTIQNGTIDVPDGETNYAYGKLTLADVDITGKAASSSLLSVNYNGSVTIDKDSTIVADSAKGDYPAVFIKGQDDNGKTYAPELNIYGTVQSAKTPAIQGNGTDRGVSHVNVFEGAVVKSESLAVYLPQPCEVNITGGLVEGYCGIGIKSGTLNISGGTVRGVANDNVIGDEYSQTNGISYDGSAIMIDSYIGYAGQVQINISGNAVVESKYSTAIREIGNDKSQTNLVGLDITGGTVLGAKDTDAVLVRDVTAKDVNISGGEFSSIVKKEYCAPGFTPVTTANSEGRYGVEIGMFTVMVTSRTTGSNSPVANVTGGGSNITYAQGTTVTASAISGYKFVGWFVNEYTGTPYSTELTCEVKPTADCTMIAVYEPISGGKFWLTVTASEFTVNGGAVQDSYLYEQFAVGASVTVNFTGSENFLYWVNASNKVVSTEKSYTFIMGSETTLKAVYGKTRQNQATVVFISHSDQIISSKAYTTSDTIQFPVPPIKMGCTFTGWSMTEAEIREAMANNNGIIQVRALYTEPSIACKVTVIYPDGIGNDVVNAVVGKAVNVTAKDIEGKTFSYWTDDKGTVLGYTKTLKLAPSGDMTVKAVYGENAEVKPVISMTAIDASAGNGYWVVSFTATRAVPAGYEMVKQGILYSLDSRCAGEAGKDYLKLTADGTVPEGVYDYIGRDTALNGVTRFNGKVGTADTTLYGRGYMILKNSAGEVLYVYADTILSGSYNSLKK